MKVIKNIEGDLLSIYNTEEFSRDNRFVYYFDEMTILQDTAEHYLIEKATGCIFVEANTYKQLISKYWFKIEVYNQYVYTDEYKNLVELYERSLRNDNTKKSNKGA